SGVTIKIRRGTVSNMDRVYLHGPPPRPLDPSADSSDSTGCRSVRDCGLVSRKWPCECQNRLRRTAGQKRNCLSCRSGNAPTIPPQRKCPTELRSLLQELY